MIYQKNFYVNILGLNIINKTYRKEKNLMNQTYKVGNSQAELFSSENPPKRISYPETCGLRHLCFEVYDIEKFVVYLNNNGIRTE